MWIILKICRSDSVIFDGYILAIVIVEFHMKMSPVRKITFFPPQSCFLLRLNNVSIFCLHVSFQFSLEFSNLLRILQRKKCTLSLKNFVFRRYNCSCEHHFEHYCSCEHHSHNPQHIHLNITTSEISSRSTNRLVAATF